jgi:hypothetical protein
VSALARRIGPVAAGVCLFAATLLLNQLAHAQRIILLCPPEADTSLTEAFNRLRGELSMHGFEVEIQTSAETISPENLASRADSVAAVASVSFVRSAGGYATADIKISDRITGKMTTRTIATPEGTDAASLLALRAVELLRASLREFGATAKPPKDIVGAAPDRASPSVRKWAEIQPPVAPEKSTVVATPVAPTKPEPAPAPEILATPTPETIVVPGDPHVRTDAHWSARVDALAGILLPGVHAAYGAGVAVGWRPSARIEAQLHAEAPWFGTEYRTRDATSKVHLFTVAAGVAYSILAGRSAELQLSGGLGVTRMTLFTTTNQPLLPLLPAAWLLMPRLGAGVNVLFSPTFFWQTSVMVAVLYPRARLHIEDRAFTVGLPLLQLSSGLGVRF